MDRRDYTAMTGPSLDGFDSFDEGRMVLVKEIENDAGETLTVELPAHREVCPLCQGKGSHVNPAIDAHGITSDEFDEDPEFRESYLRGVYDVPCYECDGKRVVPVVDREGLTPEQKADLAEVDEIAADLAEMHAEMAAERRMGA